MEQTLQSGQTLNLNIDSLAFGTGAGVGRHEGMVVFVPNTCPGDFIQVRIVNVKKKFAEGICENIISPSPHRQSPPCPVADSCGGCTWQQVDYEIQLQQKNLIVEKTFSQLIQQPDGIRPIIPSPSPFGYRNRIQLHKQNQQWGYFQKKSKQLVAIDECLIAEPKVNQLFKELKSSSKVRGSCRIELELLPSGQTKYRISGTDRDELGFSQVNSGVNQLLSDHILESIQCPEFGKIHDLYAGNGNFSFPLAKKFKKQTVFSVELNQKSHEDAAKRQIDQKLTNLHLVKSSVENYLNSTKLNPLDWVILDPPRAGLQEKARVLISESNCRNILYISCDPMTLKRDLTTFVEKGGYHVDKIQPFDMFPQTAHMEVVAHLSL